MKQMTIECPDQLASQLDEFVQAGWALNSRDAIIEAVRRFLQSHQPDVVEEQIRSDIEWGLNGTD